MCSNYLKYINESLDLAWFEFPIDLVIQKSNPPDHLNWGHKGDIKQKDTHLLPVWIRMVRKQST